MKLVCGLVLLITIQYSLCQENNATQLLSDIRQCCSSQQDENARLSLGRTVGVVNCSDINTDKNIDDVMEELRALENKVSMLHVVMQNWYKASNGYFYKMFSTRVSWQQAKAACESKGAILVSAGIRDPIVREELQKYVNLFATWIGVSDIVQEGRWVWLDGVRSTGNDVGWNPHEPNNAGGNEDCVVIFNVNNSWGSNDLRCSDVVAYMCEISP